MRCVVVSVRVQCIIIGPAWCWHGIDYTFVCVYVCLYTNIMFVADDDFDEREKECGQCHVGRNIRAVVQ